MVMTDLEKIVYDIICSDEWPPSEEQHWEGYTAKRIVAALEPIIAAAEREACAQVCLMPVDEIQITGDCSEYVHKDYVDCAEAIRARGQQ